MEMIVSFCDGCLNLFGRRKVIIKYYVKIADRGRMWDRYAIALNIRQIWYGEVFEGKVQKKYFSFTWIEA